MIVLFGHLQERRAELRRCYMTAASAPLRPSSPTRSPTKPNATARSIPPSTCSKTQRPLGPPRRPFSHLRAEIAKLAADEHRSFPGFRNRMSGVEPQA